MLALAAPAHAETAAPAADATADAGAATSGDTSGEILVTARKRVESAQSVPLTITAIGSEALDRASVRTSQDFANLVPGVFMIATSNQGETNVSIRGVSQPRGSESSFALVMDGVQMANPNAFNQQLEDIDHVEVVKGPQGAVYGRNAIGGAIVINTKKPSDELEGSFRVGVGNGGLQEGAAVISGPITSNLVARASVLHRYVDGYYENTTLGRKADTFRSTVFRGRAIWTPTANLTVDVIALNSTVDGPANLFFTQVNGVRGGFDTSKAVDSFGFDVPSLNHQHTENYSVKVDHENSLFTTTLVLAYSKLKEDQGGDGAFNSNAFDPAYTGLLGYSAGKEDGFQYQFRNETDRSAELRFTSHAHQRLRWMAGIYFLDINRDTMESNGTDTTGQVIQQPIVPGITTSVLWSHNDNQDYAAFGQLQYDITPQLEASAAVRWDKENRKVTNLVPAAYTSYPGLVRTSSYSAVQPKFTLTWKPTTDFTLYGTYGEGFKSGGFNNPGSRDLILTADPNSTIRDDYPAETSKSWEIGSKIRLFDRAVTLGLSAFTTTERNQQLFFFYPSPLVRVVATLDKTRIRGAELEAGWKVNSHLSFNAAYAVMNSKILESAAIPGAVGKKVPHTPGYTLNLGMNIDQPVSEHMTAFLSADMQAMGRVWFDPENIANTSRAPLQLLNGQVGLRTGGFTATVWAKNIFNTKYNAEAVLVGNLMNLVAIAPPRTYGLELKYAF